ncbi:MAG: hypothetical protein L0271_01510 [Gemmatimonadetes bacterium]|nr:hypothetical protein [Gemmatimonadota bacterium]
MTEPCIPMVRNTVGELTRFSVDRLARGLPGPSPESRVRAARRFGKDLSRDGAPLITTDDLRHWLLERDPGVLAHRRCVRERTFDGRWRYVDARLGRIAALAETIAPETGDLLTELFLDYFRPGSGSVAFLDDREGDGEKPKVAPVDEVELRWGDLANAIMPDADYTRNGSAGKVRIPDPSDPRQQFFFFVGGDDRLDTLVWPRPPGPILCDTPFIVSERYYRNAPGCAGVVFRTLVRAAFLYTIDEAFRLCRTSPCRDALPKLLFAEWGCGRDTAVAAVDLEVVCLAT